MRRVTEMVPRDAPDHLLRLAMLFCGQCDMDEQFSLGEQEILHIGASYGLHRQFPVAHAGTRKTCSFQFDQNARIWDSSS